MWRLGGRSSDGRFHGVVEFEGHRGVDRRLSVLGYI